MRHEQLVKLAVEWLRSKYRCGVILSEQYCASGEVPDAIGWKKMCRSVVIECKASRADFLADATKPFRLRPEQAMGSERFYLAPAGLIALEELPKHWGLLEVMRGAGALAREVRVVKKSSRLDLRTAIGFMKEMNLLLASLRRVELRIEPQTITDFLKWKNRLAEYNGGTLPSGIVAPADEPNPHLQ